MVGAAHNPAAQLCAALEGGLRAVCPLAADRGLFLEGVVASEAASLQLASYFILNYSPLSHVKTLFAASKNRWKAEICTKNLEFSVVLRLGAPEAPRVGPAPVGPFHF